MGSALLMVPEGHSADWAGFTAAPTSAESAVAGTSYRSRQTDDVSLVVGAEGASLVTPHTTVTVRFDECAAKLAWPDGARQLIGYDGMSLRIEPTMYVVDPAALATVDAAIPASAVVPMPARRPDAIPQPTPRPTPQPASTGGWFEKTLMIVLIVLASVVGVCALLGTFGVASDSTADAGVWAVIGFVWFFAALLALPAVIIARNRRQRARAVNASIRR
jgi:hypothetical protein